MIKKIGLFLIVLVPAVLCIHGFTQQDKSSDPEIQKWRRLALESRANSTEEEPSPTWVRHYPTSTQDSILYTKVTDNDGFISVVEIEEKAFIEDPEYLSLDGAWVVKASPLGNIEWQRFLRPDLNLRMYCVDGADDGGFILGGKKAYFGNTPTSGNVIKLSSSGEIEWSNIYGGESGSRITFIEQVRDGGYILCGINGTWVDGVNKDLWAMKLTSDGEVEWSYLYGGPGEEGDWIYGGHPPIIRQTSDDGFILSGNTTSFGYGSWDVWVLKLDLFGQIEWQNAYGGESNEEFLYSPNLVEAHDGSGYFFAASTRSFWESEREWFDLWIVKLNLDGSIDWQNLYGGEGGDQIGGIVSTADNGLAIAATTGSFGYGANVRLFLLKLNCGGQIDWERSFGVEGSKTSGRSIQKTKDNGFIVTGSSALLSLKDPWFLRLDSQGRLNPDCGLMENTHSFVIETTSKPFPTNVEAHEYGYFLRSENLTVVDTKIKSQVYCWSLHQPPLNLRLEKEINRSFSRSETNYILEWNPNPENTQFSIVEYRAYRVDNSQFALVYEMVGSVPSGTYAIKDSQVDTSKYLRYYVVAVDENGFESPLSETAKSWE